jgi:hypothetical protein
MKNNYSMNILNIIKNNVFLKKLFPNGLENFFIGQLYLNFYDQIDIKLHCTKKPDIEINKWGIWGKDYNIIVIELTGQFIRKLSVVNWQNNNEYLCECEVSKKDNDYYLIVFKGNNWSIEIELQTLIFQRNSTYVIES